MRKLGVRGEERGGAQEGTRASHLLRWEHRERSRVGGKVQEVVGYEGLQLR